MIKRYYSLDEAVDYLSSHTRLMVTARDLFDHIQTRRLRTCVWYSGYLARVQKDPAGFEFDDTILAFIKFRGYITDSTNLHIIKQDLIDGSNPYANYHTSSPTIIDSLDFAPPNLKEGERLALWNGGRPRKEYLGLSLWVAGDEDCPAGFPQQTSFDCDRSQVLIPATDLESLLAGKLRSDMPPAPPRHTTRLLDFQARAIERYWGATYDPSDPHTANDKATIVGWLKEQGCSDRAAKAIDLIIRPEESKKGGAKPKT